jgi:hypothetical protein
MSVVSVHRSDGPSPRGKVTGNRLFGRFLRFGGRRALFVINLKKNFIQAPTGRCLLSSPRPKHQIFCFQNTIGRFQHTFTSGLYPSFLANRR